LSVASFLLFYFRIFDDFTEFPATRQPWNLVI
jgi:hypothetical protein